MSRRGKGDGTIVLRKDGSWMASLRVDGRRKYPYGKTRREVNSKLPLSYGKLNLPDNRANLSSRPHSDWTSISTRGWRTKSRFLSR